MFLEDRDLHYISHDYQGTTISIAKNFWDTLSSCHVIFPNGVTYELYPQNTLNNPNIFFLEAVQPFTSCGVGFRGIGVEAAGKYQLMSQVIHTADNSRSLTRQNFNLVVNLPQE